MKINFIFYVVINLYRKLHLMSVKYNELLMHVDPNVDLDFLKQV